MCGGNRGLFEEILTQGFPLDFSNCINELELIDSRGLSLGGGDSPQCLQNR